MTPFSIWLRASDDAQWGILRAAAEAAGYTEIEVEVWRRVTFSVPSPVEIVPPPAPPPPPWWAGVRPGDRVTGPAGLKLYRQPEGQLYTTAQTARVMDVYERYPPGSGVWVRVYPPAGTTALPIWCRLDECQPAP